jgi:hypothetical protein
VLPRLSLRTILAVSAALVMGVEAGVVWSLVSYGFRKRKHTSNAYLLLVKLQLFVLGGSVCEQVARAGHLSLGTWLSIASRVRRQRMMCL